MTPPGATPALPTLGAAMRVWLRIGVLSFGGPAGQIALLHREIVERRRWVGERRFLRALSFATLLPGPEATQLATYLGWLMHGPIGGVLACALFVLPGAAVLLGLSALYYAAASLPAVGGIFYGLKCAVLAMVLQALLRISHRALKTPAARGIAGLAFIALFVFALPFPVVVLGAGALGALAPRLLAVGAVGDTRQDMPGLIEQVLLADPGRAARLAAAARRAGGVALALWVLPVAGLKFWVPGRFAEIAWLFSKMAVVTLGGAYAVLAYVAQDAVHDLHWLSPADMLAGLGLAETTPGPLILVLQFVGFLAGARASGSLHGFAGGLAASMLTLWVTFLPSLAFVFLGAPLMERASENRLLRAAMAGITAAVVGVIGNLTLWFGLHVVFGRLRPVPIGPAGFELPVLTSLDPFALLLAVLAGVCLVRMRWPVPATLALIAGCGLALRLVLK